VNIDTARSMGMTTDQVRQRVRSGEWLRVGRGWYLRAASLPDSDERARALSLHQMAAIAAVRRLPGSTVCGPSAAIMHGMPVRRVPGEVHLIAALDGWTGRRAGVRLHEWTVPPGHLDVAPIRITTPARTWGDVARVDGTIGAVIAGDHLLRLTPGFMEDAVRMIQELGSARHLDHAKRAVTLLDRRRESPLESASACYFDDHRLPPPDWQVTIVDSDGFIGRVDCSWDDTRVLGEADGRLKYVTAEDLYREKRREDRLRATGRRVVRWGWRDLRSPHLAARIRVALDAPTPSVTRSPST
jgi:hypothetical protein